jgi:hypothetical protein
MTINLLLINKDGLIFNSCILDGEDIDLAEAVKEHFSAESYLFSTDDNIFPGWLYIDNVFYDPSPYSQWIFDKTDKQWKPPFPKPDTGFWEWIEEDGNWQEIIPNI